MMFEPSQPVPTAARDGNRISKRIEVDGSVTVAAGAVNGASKPKANAKDKGKGKAKADD